MNENSDAPNGPNTPKAPTIYDIARLAGVNPSTVSRALSKPGRISAKTEKLIQDAAETLHYRVNPMARALPTGHTNTLGLIVADITNPVFFPFIRGAERAAAQAGYTLVLAESHESGELEIETASRIEQSVDGLVLVATRSSDNQIRELADRKPLVVVNRRIEGVDTLVADSEPGIDQALDLIATFGHRSLAYLSGPADSWMNTARWRLILAKARQRGMTIVEIGPGAPTLEGGRDAYERIMACGASAVLAYNDLMAIGLLRALQENGQRVPERLSIIGCDDIFGSDFTAPPLSTIRTPLGALGELAVLRTLERVAGAQHDASAARADALAPLATELIVRGSTGPAPTGPTPSASASAIR
ncbi:LacI family DNA-binding transcriptional regulator [Rathayibacter soli]|uniref:LacI family DNA-binding transcriptional regulator n=1 Tax=Rathayibacter soli TaxID=3144168 RepID=UPI0027E3ED07|nr:LacI family DNA-binding transcriptional regulator [Glaciibacter superstes]